MPYDSLYENYMNHGGTPGCGVGEVKNTTTTPITGECGHCGKYHSGICPYISEIEYYQDGTIKRIKYKDK